MNNNFEVFDDFTEDEGQGGFQDLRETGVYKVTMKRVGLKYNSTGSTSITVTVNGGGEYDNTFYQGVVKNADGSAGWENAKLLQPLRSLCGLTALTVVKQTIKTKDGTKEIDVFDGFNGQEIQIAVQAQWNQNNRKYEPKIVKVFNTDGRTASEIKEGKTTAEQIKYYLSDKFKDKGGPGGGNAPKGGNTGNANNPLDVDPEDVF